MEMGAATKNGTLFSFANGDAIGADLVGHVPIGGNAVRAHNHAADAAGFQEMAGHTVCDESGGDMILLQFPHGEARTLEERTRFIGEYVDFLALLDRGADHAKGGAVARGGERSGIAMSEYGFVIGHERRTMFADGLADGDVFETDLPGLLNEAQADEIGGRPGQGFVQGLHALDGPEQIDGGGAGGGESFTDEVEIGAFDDPESHAHGRCNTDGGSAANGHGADVVGHVLIGLARDVGLFQRQASLVNHDDAVGGPLDRFNHVFCLLSFVCREEKCEEERAVVRSVGDDGRAGRSR